MKKIAIIGVTPEKRLFHNAKIEVYPTKVSFEKIEFWKENYRTVLSFDLLKKEFEQIKESKISLEQIISFIADQKILQIPKLAESIKRNGVKVPMIILEDGTLLDGNRRYFACGYLKLKAKEKGEVRPGMLDDIPVWVIKNNDVNKKLRLKILAEANFVSDYKVPWSLDVKADIINDYYKTCIGKGLSEEKAYEEIYDVFSVEPQDARDYIDTFKLTQQFIATGKTQVDKDRFREIVQGNFVYFWEFRNKAMIGKRVLPATQLRKAKDLFFIMMKNDRFKNMKQVEPMIRAIHDVLQWKLLKDSGGSKIDHIEAIYKEERAVKSYEDKIRYFLNWLKRNKNDTLHFSGTAYKLLNELQKFCAKFLNEEKD
jgi:hypothetical protein